MGQLRDGRFRQAFILAVVAWLWLSFFVLYIPVSIGLIVFYEFFLYSFLTPEEFTKRLLRLTDLSSMLVAYVVTAKFIVPWIRRKFLP